MRLLLFAAAIAAALVPTAAWSQSRDIGHAVKNTAIQNMARRGYVDPQVTSALASMESELVDAWNVGKVGACTTCNATAGWVAVVQGLGIPQGVNWLVNARDGEGIDGAGGSMGGGGSTSMEDWPECLENKCENVCAFNYRLDASGNLIIPSVPLKPGGPHQYTRSGQTNVSRYWATHNQYASGVQGGFQTDNRYALILWYLHQMNKSRGDKRNWVGVWRITGSSHQFDGANTSYVGPEGTKIPHYTWSKTTSGTDAYHWLYTEAAGQTVDCPPAAVSSGDFDFYGTWTSGTGLSALTGCTWYSPNYSISSSGYFYPEEVAMPKAHAALWPRSAPAHVKACKLDAELIRQITDKLMHRATQRPGYAGPPYSPVTPDDVRTGGKHPRANEMFPNAQPTLGNPTQSTLPDEAPPASPPSTVNVSVDFGPNPGTAAPSVGDPPTGIMDPIFDWLPDLPSITLETHETDCPIWAVNLTDFFGPEGQWLVEAHCPLLENNRAMISALMVALFGLTAALIILRA